MDKSAYRDVEDYIDKAGTAGQPLLRELRQLIRENAPEAVESISYAMPGYKHLGKPLIYFGGFKNHVSLFAAGSRRVAETFQSELAGFAQSKGTIQFPLDKPLPSDLIARIVRERVAEVEEQAALRKTKPAAAQKASAGD